MTTGVRREILGIIATIVIGLIALTLIVVLVRELPGIRRSLRIRNM